MPKPPQYVRLRYKPKPGQPAKLRLKHPPPVPFVPREGSKLKIMLDLLGQPDGITMGEIITATGWSENTIRGEMSRKVKFHLGLRVVSMRAYGRCRRYYLTARDMEMPFPMGAQS